MFCESFEKLDEQEKRIYETRILHIIRTEELYFQLGILALNKSTKEGVFDNVKIGGHEVYKNNTTEKPHTEANQKDY